jgi:hypothetical protein
VALQSITAKNQSWSVAGGTRRCRTSHYTHVITNCIRAPQMAPQSGPLRHLLAISCHLMHHNCHLTPINTVILHTIGHDCHLTNHYTVIFQPVTATLHTLRSSILMHTSCTYRLQPTNRKQGHSALFRDSCSSLQSFLLWTCLIHRLVLYTLVALLYMCGCSVHPWHWAHLGLMKLFGTHEDLIGTRMKLFGTCGLVLYIRGLGHT